MLRIRLFDDSLSPDISSTQWSISSDIAPMQDEGRSRERSDQPADNHDACWQWTQVRHVSRRGEPGQAVVGDVWQIAEHVLLKPGGDKWPDWMSRK